MVFPLVYSDPGPQARKEEQLKKKRQEKEQYEKDSSPEMIKRRTPNSGVWICNNCTLTDDFFFMETHQCKYNSRNNFHKVAQRLEYENDRWR